MLNKNKLIYIDFSNYEVVKALILGRKELEDKVNSTNFGINACYGQTLTLEEIVCIYASLDSLIEKCEFDDKRTELIMLLFEGKSVVDLEKYTSRKTRGNRWLLDTIIKDMNQKAEKEFKIGGE